MKFNIGASELLEALKITKGTEKQSKYMPILNCVKLIASEKNITVYRNNLAEIFQIKMQCDTIIEGEAVTDYKNLVESLKKFKKDVVEISTDNNILNIKNQNCSMNLKLFDVADYPMKKDFEATNTDIITMTQSQLKNAIEKIVFSVSTDGSRPVLNGVCFDISENKASLVAIDGFRMAIKKETLHHAITESKFIISGKTLAYIGSLLKNNSGFVDITVNECFAKTQIDNGYIDITIEAILIKGEYMNYKSIIPTSEATRIVMTPTELKSVFEIGYTKSLTADKMPITITTEGEILIISSRTESGESKAITDKIQKTGKDFVLDFNPRYFSDITKRLDGKLITIATSGERSPMTIETEDNNTFYLILPMRR